MSSGDNTESRTELLAKLRRNDKDVGSPEVQVALLTDRLQELTGHVKAHPMDLHSQRGMQKIISRRKRLLAYLKGSDFPRYKQTIDTLGLRK